MEIGQTKQPHGVQRVKESQLYDIVIAKVIDELLKLFSTWADFTQTPPSLIASFAMAEDRHRGALYQ